MRGYDAGIVADPELPRLYTREEAEAILRRALEQESERSDGVGHDDLVEAAREVGLDEGAVNRAGAHVREEQGAEVLRQAVAARRRAKWLRHLVIYLAVVGGFLGLHLLGLVGAWVWWMAFGWGIGLALDTHAKLSPPSDKHVRREARRRARRRRREAQARRAEAERKARLRAQAEREARRKKVGEDLERVIEEGVEVLLGAAANKLKSAKSTLDGPPKTEFRRYVDRQRGRGRGCRPSDGRSAPGPHVRVDDEEPEEEEVASEGRRSKHRRAR
ncbi:MAG: 2TM domain-containing protein [Sandaracinaceae bacterium]